MFLLPAPPQLLYQAPPGAQQLTLPDLRNVPHFGHATALATVEVAGGVRTISSRSGMHTVADSDPRELENMAIFLAFE